MNKIERIADSDLSSPREISATPLLARRDYDAPSVFLPESLLREARRQKGLIENTVPPVCVLDPDGDLVDHVRADYGAARSAHWACYHTQMWEWQNAAARCGIIGAVVGGPFAVLVAEQLFASGCELLISITSAGQIADLGPPPYYILIDRALRDEGTSHHYLAPSAYAHADPALMALAQAALGDDPDQGLHWSDVDHRRAIPGDRIDDCGTPGRGNPCGGDGKRRALRLCGRAPSARNLRGACVEPARPSRR